MKLKFSVPSFFIVLAMMAGLSTAASAQSGTSSRKLVITPVDDGRLITRTGNVHPAVTVGQDMGRMEVDRSLQHLRLQLTRPAETEAALQAYLNDLQNPKSANYHKWGTSQQFVQQFGLAQSDIQSVVTWLSSQGLTVNFVTPNMTIDFSGSSLAVGQAFHTEIHNFNVNGVNHFANISDPQIPAALANAVLGPVALHDFKPHKLTSKVKPPIKQYTVNADYQLVVPGDLATIYDYNPLFAQGVSGQGQTLVALERTDLYSNGDFSTFRKVFGLTKSYPQGKLVVVHPQPTGATTTENGQDISSEACSDPGVLVGDDGEATLDVEWMSASAPNATIELASCADTDTNFGAFIALENLLAAPTTPQVMSLSYGSSESENGVDGNAYINALYQYAVFRGVSLFVSTGDADADVTDQDRPYAQHGINVNALASTPNDVAVGGTDYGDSFLGENSTYWNQANSATFSSARSYIPEITWNDSCASQLIDIVYGYAQSYGSGGFCNSTTGRDYYLDTAGGSGGPSACSYGTATVPGVVSGTCSGYAKPSYQSSVYGNPADGVRDLPDVSMFAANGVWGHYFVFCYTDPDPNAGGVPCPSNNPSTWAGAGGTSFSAPIWAGIQGLINQATASAQGNPSSNFYALAATEYGASGNPACNSTLGNGSASTCIFHDVTLGDIDAPCYYLGSALYNCYGASTQILGALSTSNSTFQPAYVTNLGYDFPTGLGTPDVHNLVTHFPGSKVH